MNPSQITEWCHSVIASNAVQGGTYIDATMGNGNDTLFLCRLAGQSGHVWAFDIQECALQNTKALLLANGCLDQASLILDGHEHMSQYLEPESADVICFNFGYLPGILTYLKTLAPKEYTVIVNEYYNRGNCPPLPVFIFKK